MTTATARRAAGWRWVAALLPAEYRIRIKQIASTYRLSQQEVMLHGLTLAIYQSPAGYWSRCAKAEKVRMPRKDKGVKGLRRKATKVPASQPASNPSQSRPCETTIQAYPPPQDLVVLPGDCDTFFTSEP